MVNFKKFSVFSVFILIFGLFIPKIIHAEETLKFGMADPLTGPAAIFGKDQAQAVTWAVEDINAAGGVRGRKLEAIILDHQAKPDKIPEKAHRAAKGCQSSAGHYQ